MKLSLRIKMFNWTFFSLLSKTQRLSGIVSRIENNEFKRSDNMHILLWDLESCTLDEAINELRRIQIKYDLSDIFITTDRVILANGKYPIPKGRRKADGMKSGFNAWCFTVKPFVEYIHILTDTRYTDFQFLWWTMHYCEATLRITPKEGRGNIKCLARLRSYDVLVPFGKKILINDYDTGSIKRGIQLRMNVFTKPRIGEIPIVIRT